MKNGQTEHYWRHHAKVANSLLGSLPLRIQDVIASDPLSAEFLWFEAKVKTDAQRLYEDPNHYENAESRFRLPKDEGIPKHWRKK